MSSTRTLLVRNAVERLQRAGVPDASDSVRFLLEHCAQQKREGDVEYFESLLRRRMAREPVQYIVGEWDFHNLKSLLMRRPMLIPRPETEEFVEFVLENTRPRKRAAAGATERTRVLDVGAGTGAIGLALLHARRTEFSVQAIDCLPEACELANENAKRLGLSAEYACQHVAIKDYAPAEGFDIIVSNPPYIPSKELLASPGLEPEVLEFESHLALDGGDDGGQVAREILRNQRIVRANNGAEETNLFFELHHTHNEYIVKSWLAGTRWEYVKAKSDFMGYQRFYWLRNKEAGREINSYK